MSRFMHLLGKSSGRKLAHAILASSKPSGSGAHNVGSGLAYKSRAYLHGGVHNGPSTSFMLGRAKESLYRNPGARNFSVLSACSRNAFHSQLAWKQLVAAGSRVPKASPVLSRVACALTLAATRSKVVPYLVAFVAGEFMLAEKGSADGEYLPIRENIYMRAQDSRIYVTSLLFSAVEMVIIILRSIYLAFLFTPSILMAPFADNLGSKYRKTWLRLVHRTLERAGPAFIKWGQWAATRPDLFANDLCTELSKLHTKAPAHSYAYTKKTVEKAFGRKISDIFEDFEEDITPSSPAPLPSCSTSSWSSSSEKKRMSDWGPVVIAVVLFVLLSPGLLLQLPGKHHFVEFGNMHTSAMSILVHAIIYFALIALFVIVIGVHITTD